MSDAIRILLIEDDSSDQKLIRTALENGLEHVQIEVVDKRHLIQDALNADRVDIVLSDYELKGFTGLDVVSDVKNINNDIPIIILTGEDNDQVAIEILKRGVDDFIIKSLKFIRLLPAKIIQLLAQKNAANAAARDEFTILADADSQDNSDSTTQSSNRFISAFEHSPIAFAIGDQHGYILSANHAGTELVGYSKEELLGKNFLEIVHMDERDEVREEYRKLFTGESYGYNVDRRYLHKQGHTVWCDCNVSLIADKGGNAPFALVQAKDINARKQAEHQINGVLESAPDAIVITNENGEIGLINNQAQSLFGYSQSELAGKMIETLIPDGLQSAYLANRNWLIGDAEDSSLENMPPDLIAVDKNGREFPVDVSLAKFETEEGCFESIGIRDITAQKRAVENLRESNERFQNSFKYAAIGMWLGEKDGTIKEANPSACKITGYSESELIGKNLREITHPDDLAISVDHHARLFSGEIDNYNLIKQYRHKDGHYIWADVSVALVRNKEGVADYSIVHVNDITKEKEISEELSYHASHDALTDLVNRREFERRTERLLSNIKVEEHEHALCYMDLDQFKLVNDTCGHVAGDELLRQLSTLLKITVRKRDTLARLGGDEFGILMEHCSLDHAHRVAKSLQKAIQEYQFSWEGHNFKVGVSMGLIAITQNTQNLTELLKNADTACYMAKDAGRNRIHIYHSEDSMVAKRHGDMQWVERLHKALEEDRFCLYAQSIVPLDRSKSKQYEILLRMIDEQGNVIAPGAFLPAAELYDIMSKLDAFVIEKTFGLLAAHPILCEQVNSFSINLSGQSLAEPNFLNFVITQLEESGIESNKICFEITETAAISNVKLAKKFISTLKELGCYFALDDFGSGLSSFGYLKNLPVDFLKIDGMFVKNIVDDPIDHAMVKSINEIGHVMGMQTIAEFVENDEIKGMLREIGVNYAQGYGIDKPQPFNEILARANNVTDIKDAALLR